LIPRFGSILVTTNFKPGPRQKLTTLDLKHHTLAKLAYCLRVFSDKPTVVCLFGLQKSDRFDSRPVRDDERDKGRVLMICWLRIMLQLFEGD
jgi:hypothetical protein